MQHSIVQCRSCAFTQRSSDFGGAISVAGLSVRAGGIAHWGADAFSMSSRQGYLYLVDTQVARCRSRNSGGVMSVAFGHVVFVFRSSLSLSSARNYGGLIHTESGGSVFLLSSSMTNSSARTGGCVSVFFGFGIHRQHDIINVFSSEGRRRRLARACNHCTSSVPRHEGAAAGRSGPWRAAADKRRPALEFHRLRFNNQQSCGSGYHVRARRRCCHAPEGRGQGRVREVQCQGVVAVGASQVRHALLWAVRGHTASL